MTRSGFVPERVILFSGLTGIIVMYPMEAGRKKERGTDTELF